MIAICANGKSTDSNSPALSMTKFGPIIKRDAKRPGKNKEK